MELLAEIQNSLNKIAPDLFEHTLHGATQALNDAFEDLAYQFANDAELLFGVPPDADLACKYPKSEKRILVCRGGKGRCLHPTRDTQGGFLFDNCWLIYNSSEAADYPDRLAGCELVMESEWQFDSRDEFKFFQDFRKLLIANARVKVFIFRSLDSDSQGRTFANLQAEIKGFGMGLPPQSNYLLCGWCSGKFSYETVAG